MRRLPRSVKMARGTFHPEREAENPAETDPCDVPRPPRGSSEAYRANWREVAAQIGPDGNRTYTRSCYTALRLLVQVLTMADNIPANMPASAAVRLLQIAAGLLAKFGLDPASAGSVESHPEPTADELDEFFVSAHRHQPGRDDA